MNKEEKKFQKEFEMFEEEEYLKNLKKKSNSTDKEKKDLYNWNRGNLKDSVVILVFEYFKDKEKFKPEFMRTFLCKGGKGTKAYLLGTSISGEFLIDGEKHTMHQFPIERFATKEEIQKAEEYRETVIEFDECQIILKPEIIKAIDEEAKRKNITRDTFVKHLLKTCIEKMYDDGLI